MDSNNSFHRNDELDSPSAPLLVCGIDECYVKRAFDKLHELESDEWTMDIQFPGTTASECRLVQLSI